MKKVVLIAAAALAVGAAQAQKPKVSSAETMLTLQRFDDAKSNIDEALANEKTSTWPNTYIVASKVYAKLDAQNKAEGGLQQAKEYILKAKELDQKGDAKGKGIGKYAKDINKAYNDIANEAVNVGINSFNTKNYANAKYAFSTVIWAHKEAQGEAYQAINDTVFILNTALAALQEGDFAYAAPYFEQCAEAKYDGPMSIRRAAYCYGQINDSINQERTLQFGFQTFPEDKDVLTELIQFYLTAGQNDKALNYLNTAIAEDPTNALFYYARGCLNEKINMEDAIADYLKAIELKSDLFNAIYNLAVVYYNKGIDTVNKASGERDQAKYDVLMAESNADFAASAPYFEKAAECTDNVEHKKLVYEQLKAIYYRLHNDEKNMYYNNLLKEL